ncbi:aspartyl protease family protein [Fodinicola acaciae]|uniref:aspartyl protease family protein n=1 Tax=Fodinicola acaciae TaxID=2681555 RepID=UPI0013D1ECFA|nr:aspartyl protease family protein [Fodinicola acaciae]
MLAGATVPFFGGAAVAEPGSNADALFAAGKFEQAGRAYEEILRKEPENLRAARQRGYVGLLSNRFTEAEKYFKVALRLAPADKETNWLLGDCYIRQDKFALSVPCWQAAGEEAYATWFAAVRGNPYEIHGDTGRVPFLRMDPSVQVQASVNGGPLKRFSFYTGAPWLGVSAAVAKEAGLKSVYKQKTEFENGFVWMYFGMLDSFKIGGIEVRNVPVGWSEPAGADVPPQTDDGLIGTWFFYHLLTTFDYAGRSLILRRRTSEAARKARAGSKPLPMWLALEHYVHSQGSFAGSTDSGPRVVGVNLGGNSEIIAGLRGKTAEQLGIRSDYDREIGTFGSSHPAVVYPCYPNEVRLGDAVAKGVYCYNNPNQKPNVPWPYGTGFDTIGWFSHCFWKPYNVTLDFTEMRLYIARGKATG